MKPVRCVVPLCVPLCVRPMRSPPPFCSKSPYYSYTHLVNIHTQAPAQAPATEVDVVIRDLKGHPGFSAYMILNNDGTPKRQGEREKRGRRRGLSHLLAIFSPTSPGLAWSGIVIKHEGVEYKRAVQFAQLVLGLLAKAKRAVKGVLDPADVRTYLMRVHVYVECFDDVAYSHKQLIPFYVRQNEMESLRLKTRDYELLAGQSGAYTLVVIQQQQAQQLQQQHQGAGASLTGGAVAPGKHGDVLSADSGGMKEAK